MAELDSWDITAANNNSAPPDGWPETTMQYSEVNNTAREGMAVVARFWKDVNGELQLAGSVNVYTVTLNASYTAYFQGMYFAAEVNITNTGAVTINVNGISAQTVVNQNGDALIAAELTAGAIHEFRYDGTNFQLLGTIVADGSITLAKMADMATDSFIGRDTAATGVPEILSAATARTILNVENGSTADQTSIVGITGTKAQFDTAVTDGNIAYAGGAFHDGFSDFLAAEHIDWAVTGSEEIDEDRLRTQTKIKTADEPISSTTLQDDNHLVSFNLVTGARYTIEAWFSFTGSATTADFQIALVFTNLPTDKEALFLSAIGLAGATLTAIAPIDTNLAFGTGVDTDDGMMIRGGFQANGSTGGTMKLQWASLGVGTTILREDSWIKITKVP